MMFFRSWNYLILLFLFQAAIPMLSYAESIDFGRYHALLIANKKYTYWEQLKTPYNDVYHLEKTLKNKYDFKVEILRDVTRDKIIDKLEELKRTLTSRDNLLIYYAGHGIMREDGGYWIGIDAKKKSRSKWLHVKTISGLISRNNKMRARHVLIIADSCYAGTLTRGRKNDRTAKKGSEKEVRSWFTRMSDKYSRTALTSGGNEPVIDHVGNSRHSIFADELIRYLKENNEALDTTSLYNQIKRQVHARASRITDYAQAPEYADIPGTGDSRGDFIFVPKGTTIKFPPIYKKENNYATRKESSVPALTATLRISAASYHIKKKEAFTFQVERLSNGKWKEVFPSEVFNNIQIETTGKWYPLDDGSPRFGLKGKGNTTLQITDRITGGSTECFVFFEE